jgi:hypothetical protein
MSRHSHSESDDLNTSPILRSSEGPQPDKPGQPYSSDIQPSSHPLDHSSPPENLDSLIFHCTIHPDLLTQASQGTTGSELHREYHRLSNEARTLQGNENANGEIVSASSQPVNPLYRGQLSPGTGQESPKTAQDGPRTDRKLFTFFKRDKKSATAVKSSHNSNIVGVHYRVGKKIGERSTFVSFEGTNILNSQRVAIMFVCVP